MNAKNSKLFLIFLTFVLSNFLASQTEISDSQMLLLEQLPPDQRSNIMEKMNRAQNIQTEIEEIFDEGKSLTLKPELIEFEDHEDYCPECIYGFNFFQYSPTTFAPVDNSPVTSNYL